MLGMIKIFFLNRNSREKHDLRGFWYHLVRVAKCITNLIADQLHSLPTLISYTKA